MPKGTVAEAANIVQCSLRAVLYIV